ncbi:MAG: AgmX/PglI C-terminal domain-containing protein [Polyangiaceae bacterium]
MASPGSTRADFLSACADARSATGRIMLTAKGEEQAQVVRAGRGKQKGCYETTLGSQPGAAGRAVVHFFIRADGTTTDVSVKSEGTLSDARFDRCLGDAFASLSFPVAGEQTEVTYPLEFSP